MNGILKAVCGILWMVVLVVVIMPAIFDLIGVIFWISHMHH